MRTTYPKIKGVNWSKIHDTNTRKFLLHVHTELKQAGGSLDMHQAKSVKCEGFRVGGYFDSEDSVLAVAMKRPFGAWVRILVHEYSHFEQCRYDVPAWRNSTMPNGEDSGQILWDWIEKKGKVTDRRLVDAMYRTLDVELDCERRAVENLKRFGLPINVEAYARQAAAYMYFHPYSVIRRRWYRPRHAPYMYPEIIKAMPVTLAGDFRKISAETILLFDKYC